MDARVHFRADGVCCSGEAAITQLGDTTQDGRRLDRSQIGVVVELVGPDGLLNQLTKNVFETASARS